MAKAKIKLEDGSEVEGELLGVPEGLLTQAQLDKTVSDRVKAAELKTRAAVLDEEDFESAFYTHRALTSRLSRAA